MKAPQMRIERRADGTARIHIGGRIVSLPRSPFVRVAMGVALILGGLVGFLPIVGFWMIPLGLLVLAIDYPPAGRLARNILARIRLWRQRRRRKDASI